MGAKWIKVDDACFEAGFILSFSTEKEFISFMTPDHAYPDRPQKDREKLLKAMYKGAQMENKKE